MQGYQFVHMETYSVKGAPGASPDSTAKKKSGQRAWTAQEIIDEAERNRLASLHVPQGGPPIEIMPGDVTTFAELREAHSKAASKKEVFGYTNKDGSATERTRKLRSDAPTLHTSIVSLPVTSQDALRDPAILTQCREVLHAAMAQERRRIEALGGKIMLGVIHLDESHVHAHFYALDIVRGRVDHLHPGKAAKKAFHDENAGGDDMKALRKAGNKMYCDAMRGWQDEMHEKVFSPAGLMRLGPRNARMTTAEYNRLKKARATQAADANRAAALAAQIEEQKGEIREAMKVAEDTEKALKRQAVALHADKIDLLVRENEAATLSAQSREEIERGRSMVSTAKAVEAAMTRGMQAVEDREIDYSPAINQKPEKLVFGPKAPEEKSARDMLSEAIRPAYDMLLGFARRMFGLREREKALAAAEAERDIRQKALLAAEAERQVREAELDVEEAELRRRARVVDAAVRQSGQAVPASLQDVVARKGATMTEDSFPGAWTFSPGDKVEEVSELLNKTTNLDLRAAYQATRDAMLLTETDDALRSRFALAVQVIEANAGQRGLDLDTGKQDLAKAKEPDIAKLHCDQFIEIAPVKQKARGREKLRGS